MSTIGVVPHTMSSPRVARPQSADSVRLALRRGREHRRWRARVADVLEAAALLTLVVVVVQFFLGGGSHALLDGSAGDRLVGVGRVVGLVAMDLLLIQLLLAARVPWVDRAYGMDRALKAHRVLGRVTVPLVIVHVGAIVLGYAVREGSTGVGGALRQFLSLVTGGDDLLMATVSTTLLVVIAVTSVSIARKRLSYEWWHAVHLTAYAAVILAVPHELSIGSDFTASSWATAYWWTLFAVVAASVLWWRFLLPVWRTLRHDLRVTKVVREGDDVWSVIVQGRGLSHLPLRAGQYLNWRFVTPGLFLAAHPWSVSRRPDGHTLRITVRGLGDHSAALAHLRRGTRVLVEGPYGAFTTQSRTRRRVLLIAAGIGVTPVRAILEELVVERHAAAGDVTVLYRAAEPSQMPLLDEISRLTTAGGHTLVPLIGPRAQGSWLPPLGDGSSSGRGARGVTGSDTERLRALVPEVARHEVYLCGPGPWMYVGAQGTSRRRCARQAHPRREVQLVRKATSVIVGLTSAGGSRGLVGCWSDAGQACSRERSAPGRGRAAARLGDVLGEGLVGQLPSPGQGQLAHAVRWTHRDTRPDAYGCACARSGVGLGGRRRGRHPVRGGAGQGQLHGQEDHQRARRAPDRQLPDVRLRSAPRPRRSCGRRRWPPSRRRSTS